MWNRNSVIRFKEKARKKRQDEHRRLIYCKATAWMIYNGYLPRNQEWSLGPDGRELPSWKPGDLYLNSRHLERQGMPPFPKYLEYCNIFGMDLEQDVDSWELTSEFLRTPDQYRTKISELIYAEASKHYRLENFPISDNGPLSLIIQIQDIAIAFQRRVVAASPQLEEGLEKVSRNGPA